jgi:hypothetical protein
MPGKKYKHIMVGRQTNENKDITQRINCHYNLYSRTLHM